ncbi:unnamed protein product [Vitrella brassicaformis CCMP3155]|uniref:Uncharacterized protein n=1 Tax=Vitrella brassicaformis (strain CCMP3155) TaxID=1169540 RepID=A0A0G4H5T3_VITBC|nr:unnamed protein product [Vitrella brassicaformis CCMP3155]|eukprot:CEM39203.1 unnamed protein product [Vitrella brassicaformis CCMP3155]
MLVSKHACARLELSKDPSRLEHYTNPHRRQQLLQRLKGGKAHRNPGGAHAHAAVRPVTHREKGAHNQPATTSHGPEALRVVARQNSSMGSGPEHITSAGGSISDSSRSRGAGIFIGSTFMLSSMANPTPRRQKFKDLKAAFLDEATEILRSGKLPHKDMQAIDEVFRAMTSNSLQKYLTRKAFAVTLKDAFGGKATALVSRLFTLLDHDSTHHVTNEEFLKFFALMLRGSLEAKLFYAFHTYDMDGDETLGVADLFKHIKIGTHLHPFFGEDLSRLVHCFAAKNVDTYDVEEAEGITYDEFCRCSSWCSFPGVFEKVISDHRGKNASSGAHTAMPHSVFGHSPNDTGSSGHDHDAAWGLS